MKTVYVVTCPELGWDCVIGVYNSDTLELEDLEKEYPSQNYVISTLTVETKI